MFSSIPPIYAFGSNGSSQLGIGHDEDVSVPTRCMFEESGSFHSSESDASAGQTSFTLTSTSSQEKVAVKRIAAGGNHTLILLSDGRVCAAGEDSDGRCGGVYPNGKFKRVTLRDSRTDSETEPGTRCDFFKDISATWESSILVALDFKSGSREDGEGNEIFVLGSGSKGELGLGPNTTISPTAQSIPDFPPRDQGKKIISISSGMSHTVVVLSDGSVYGWGASRKGQLGSKYVPEKIVWSPKRIAVPEGIRVTGAVCGREFTVLCGDREAGEVFVMGAGAGTASSLTATSASESETISSSATDKWGIISGIPPSSSIKGFTKILASWHGIYIHQANQTLLSWGRNDRGQLPFNSLQGVQVKDIAVGSEHGLVLREDGNVVAFGWGEHGNCGPGTDERGNVKGCSKRIELRLPRGLEVVGLGGGCATSWIVTG